MGAKESKEVDELIFEEEDAFVSGSFELNSSSRRYMNPFNDCLLYLLCFTYNLVYPRGEEGRGNTKRV